MNLAGTTVLTLGARGRFRRATFTLAGRTCIRSDGGGLWNEWRVRFDDGREATLAEAHGAFTLYFESSLEEALESPPALASVPSKVGPGSAVRGEWVVVERGRGTRVASWGRVEKAPKTYRYVDLSSVTGAPATLDASGETFLGTRVGLTELGLTPRPRRPRFFAAPRARENPALHLRIGKEAVFGKTRFRVIGALGRTLKDDGETWSWHEYLLHDAAAGFRWLVRNDAWTFVERIEPGLVADREESATYDGETYAWSSGGKARIAWAVGELPWEAAIGDAATVHDFTRGKRVLSFEGTKDEISWSLGTILSDAAVRRAFEKAQTQPSKR